MISSHVKNRFLASYLFLIRFKVLQRASFYAILAISIAINCFCSGAKVSTSSGNRAIDGYDTVAFFKEGKALVGKDDIRFTWKGADWLFASIENRDLFSANPEKYAPQYGGFCAWAMTEARKAHTDPKNWKIVKGKLYLNCSKTAMKKWEKDIPGNIIKADANWKKIR